MTEPADPPACDLRDCGEPAVHGGLCSSHAGSQRGLATGGVVPAGMTWLVGEHGCELLDLPASGTVVRAG